ncbi:MAG: hypothetical protein U0324_01885 [Polyangiales bacterium]
MASPVTARLKVSWKPTPLSTRRTSSPRKRSVAPAWSGAAVAFQNIFSGTVPSPACGESAVRGRFIGCGPARLQVASGCRTPSAPTSSTREGSP